MGFNSGFKGLKIYFNITLSYTLKSADKEQRMLIYLTYLMTYNAGPSGRTV